VEEKMTMEDIPMQTETVGDMETEGIEEFREMGEMEMEGMEEIPVMTELEMEEQMQGPPLAHGEERKAPQGSSGRASAVDGARSVEV
jgi:hypothetical protein